MRLHRLKSLLRSNKKLRTRKRNLKNNILKLQRILPLIRIDEPQRYHRFCTTCRNPVKKQGSLFIIIAASFSVTGVPYKTVKDFPAFTMLQPKLHGPLPLERDGIQLHKVVKHLRHSPVKDGITKIFYKRLESPPQFCTKF